MGLLGLFGGGSINSDVAEARSVPGSAIVDVRTPGEFAQGHIEGAVNVPLDRLGASKGELGGADTPLYVYCLSGGRSASACRLLQAQGYTQVRNMGGISGWRGAVVKGAR